MDDTCAVIAGGQGRFHLAEPVGRVGRRTTGGRRAGRRLEDDRLCAVRIIDHGVCREVWEHRRLGRSARCRLSGDAGPERLLQLVVTHPGQLPFGQPLSIRQTDRGALEHRVTREGRRTSVGLGDVGGHGRLAGRRSTTGAGDRDALLVQGVAVAAPVDPRNPVLPVGISRLRLLHRVPETVRKRGEVRAVDNQPGSSHDSPPSL